MYKPIYENDEKDKAVSPIIATILIVAITVVLAATLYAVISGYGGLIGKSTPTAGVTVSTSGNTATITVNSVSGNLSFSDIKLQVTDGSGASSGSVVTVSFSSVSTATSNHYVTTGTPIVYVNLTVGPAKYLSGLTSFTVAVHGGTVSALKMVDTSTSGTVFSWPS